MSGFTNGFNGESRHRVNKKSDQPVFIRPAHASLMRELYEQLFNPQHCYITIDGEPICHSIYIRPEEPLYELRGKPIRFTIMAAKRVVKQTERFGRSVKMVPNVIQ